MQRVRALCQFECGRGVEPAAAGYPLHVEGPGDCHRRQHRLCLPPPGLWVSTDSGASFTELQTQPPKTWSILAVQPEAELLAVVNYADVERNALRLSFDLGKTWPQRIALPLEGDAPRDHTWHDLIGMAASKDGSTLLLLNNYGWLYRSRDRGATWDKISSITTAKPNATAPTQPAG